MMFTVIHDFKDLQDDDHIYRVGDLYPRNGYKPSEKRIAELLGKRNKIGEKLIEEIADPKAAKDNKLAEKIEKKPAESKRRKAPAKKAAE